MPPKSTLLIEQGTHGAADRRQFKLKSQTPLLQRHRPSMRRFVRRKLHVGKEASSMQIDDASKDPASSTSSFTPDAAVQGDCSYGMHVLVAKPHDEAGLIDIVALHGLNGHYYHTWTLPATRSSPACNWLERSLPREVPKARVMSYSYDSAVFAKSQASIGDFADLLLEGLMAERSSVAEKERPLLFICHSLGGIVFKKALIRARERDRYEQTLQKVRGVAFFGTPHRGSSIADWTSILGRILKAASPGVNANTQLLDSLRTQSEVLYDISTSFVDRGKGLSILSFLETQALPPLNTMVVDKSSATLFVPNETVVPLPGDHRSICRFSNTKEYELQRETVLRYIGQVCEDMLWTEATFVTTLSHAEQRLCLKQLYPGNYESFKDFNVESVPGTCEWVLRHPQYRSWSEGDTSCLLWVSADAGCGKSTLAKFLVDRLRTISFPEKPPFSVCHFFFKEGISEQESTVLALRAILHQIFTRDRALMRHFLPSFEAKGEAVMSELNTLVQVLTSITRDPESPSFIIVFDGLDECSEAHLRGLLQAINSLYQADNKPTRASQFLKILMLSRPENLIKNTLKRQPMTIRLRGENEIESIGKDVSLVIRHLLDGLEEDGIPHDLLNEFGESLEHGADNTFLWVTLMIQILKDRNQTQGGTSRKEIRQLLSDHSIYSVYNHLLKKIGNHPDTRKMVEVILAGSRPLSILEMGTALASSPAHCTLEDVANDIKYPCEDYVKSLGGHFIRIIHSEIFLVHQTARSFLLNFHEVASQVSRPPRGLGWQHSFTIDAAHCTLAMTCISYMVCVERSLQNCRAPLIPAFADTGPSALRNEVPHVHSQDDTVDKIQWVLPSWSPGACTTVGHDFDSSCGPFWWYALESWRTHLSSSAKAGGRQTLIDKVWELCQIVPNEPGYPLWTRQHWYLSRAQHKFLDTQFRGRCWDRGSNLSPAAKIARVVAGIHITDVMTRFLELHTGAHVVDGDPLLHIAAALGMISDILLILENGADIHALDSEAQTIAHLALENNTLQDGGLDDADDAQDNNERLGPSLLRLLSFLISRGADINSRGREGNTALHWAVRACTAAAVRMLLQLGADTSVRNYAGETPLWVETPEDCRELVELVLDQAPHSVEPRGDTIVHIVHQHGSASMKSKILPHAADLVILDDDGHNPSRFILRRSTVNPDDITELHRRYGRVAEDEDVEMDPWHLKRKF